MAYTLATAVTQVRSLLNEDTAVFWTDTELENWIKEGCLAWSSGSLTVESSFELTLIANQLSYSSSDDANIANVLEIHSAYYDDQSNNYKALIKGTSKNLGHVATSTAGAPKYIFLHNRKLYIWPLTTAAIVSAGGTVHVLFSKETDDITALNDEFQIWPIHFSAAKALQKDRRYAEASMHMNQFYTMLNFERGDKYIREVDAESDFLIPKSKGRR